MKISLNGLIYAGCGQIDFPSAKRTVIFINFSAWIGAVVFSGYALFYATVGFRDFLPVLGVYTAAVPCILFTILLNQRKSFLLAGIWMNLASSVPVFINSWFFFGNQVGTHYFFILFSLLPIFSLGNRKPAWILSLSFMNLAFFFLVYQRAPNLPLPEELMSGTLVWTNYISILFSLATVVIVFFIYQQILFSSESELEERTDALEQAVHEVNHLIAVDGLTGISSRGHLDNQINQEITRAVRQLTPLSIVMFDLDHFKALNDRYGHAAGDEALVRLTGLVAAVLRKTDCFGRWGGEEFLIAMPETELRGALLVAEKLRVLLEGTVHGHSGNVTASFGVAQWWQGDSVETLCKRADEAMYVAKGMGRNRVCPVLPNEG